MEKKQEKQKKQKKLSKYPKTCISISQQRDEEILKKEREERGEELKCSCGSTEFMITATGLEVCAKCFNCMGFIL